MNNRWLILIAGCLIQTILGGVYAWTIFANALGKDYGLSLGESGFILGFSFLAFTSAMVFAGRVLIKKGPRFTASISAILFTLGYLLASFSGGNFVLLFTGIALIVGCGIGFGYVCPLTVGMKWFPERKGLVSGIAVAGFGAGAILLSNIGGYLLNNGMDVLVFFRWFGIVAGVILFASAMVLSNPPQEEEEKRAMTANTDRLPVFTWPFMLMVVGIFAGTFAGLLVIGQLKPMLVEKGMPLTWAAWAVSIFSIGNGVGRIIWGKLFDSFGYVCIPISLLTFVPVMALLLVPMNNWMALGVVGLNALCFGANFVLYASAISKYFGMNAFPRLYPICFMAYGIAGALVIGFGGLIADKTGSFNVAIYICIATLLVGGVVTALKLPTLSAAVKKSQDNDEPRMEVVGQNS